MAFIWQKRIGENTYFYVRVSKRRGDYVRSKDIKYLGSNISKEELNEFSKNIEKKYEKEIFEAEKELNLKLIELEKKEYNLEYIPDYLSVKEFGLINEIQKDWNERQQELNENDLQDIEFVFISSFSYSSNAIEGNTMDLKEVQDLFLYNITPKDKTLEEVYMNLNTRKVRNYLNEIDPNFNKDTIIKVHDILIENIDVRVGFKKSPNVVFKSRFETTDPSNVELEVGLLLRELKKNQKMHPLVLATIFHHKFEKIHPFSDGNGRTGRVLMNFILEKNGLPPLVINKKRRMEYFNALKSCDKIQEISDFDPMKYKKLIKFVIKEFVNTYYEIFGE